MTEADALDTHLQEVRRGTVVVASLRLLRGADYGYRLLEQLTDRGFDVDANTLYPLLRRLEKQGYLTSEWNTEQTRPRKFYRTSAAGAELADTLSEQWRVLAAAIAALAESPAALAESPASAASAGSDAPTAPSAPPASGAAPTPATATTSTHPEN